MLFTEPPSPKPAVGIDLIPLINVIFLMLIFFMVAGSIHQPQWESVELPITKHQKEQAIVNQLVIIVDAKGNIMIDEEEVMQEELDTMLKTWLATSGPADYAITLIADRMLKASKIVSLMQHLQRLGVHNIAMVVEVE